MSEVSLRVRVRSAGPVAARVLQGAAVGHVMAVFGSTFYFKTPAGIVCVGNAHLAPGPLNLVTMAPVEMTWSASGPRMHDDVMIDADGIGIAGRFFFSTLGMTSWKPPSPSKRLDVDRTRRGQRAFRDAAATYLPGDGLSPYVNPGFKPGDHQHACRFAAASIGGLQAWLATVFPVGDAPGDGNLCWVERMIGLGPGLTPSGDDLIGGVMVMLRELGETQHSCRLWRRAKGCSEAVGNRISHAHLAAAAHGMGSSRIHEAIAAITHGTPTDIADSVAGISRIGHTSGWDAMAGVLLTLDAWLASRTR